MAGINLPIISKFDDKGVKQAQGAFDGIGSSLGKLAGLVTAAFSVSAITNFTKDSIAAAREAEGIQTRLRALLINTGAATEEQIVTLNKQAAALEKVGVVTKENVTMAQSQLATFDLQAATIEKLTPAIIDYVLAEKGATASTDDFRSMTNGLAQALNGNFASLTRQGFVLSENQKQLLKTGTESEKAAALTDILNSTYQGFNETLAETPEGKLIKLQNEMGALKEEIGIGLLPTVTAFQEALIPIVQQLGPALAVVFEEVGILVRDLVLPKLQEFADWLSSADGTQTVKDLAEAVITVTTAFFDLVAFLIENRETLVNIAVIIGGFTIAVKLATAATAIHTAALGLMATASGTATIATGSLGTALRLLPWAAVAVGVASLIQSFADYSNAVYGSKVNTTGLTEEQIKQARRVEDLQRLLGQYNYALANGNEVSKQLARDGIAKVTAELQAMGIRADVAGQHIKDLNKLSLGNLQKEVFNASSHLKDLAGVAAQVAGATPPVFKTVGVEIGDNLVKGMQSKTKDVEKAAKELAKAAVPAGFEWVQGPNGPYLEFKSFTSGQSDRGVGDFGAASASYLLRQQGLNQAEIDKVLTRTIGGTLDQVNATMNSGVTLIDRATNRMIQGNLSSSDVAERVSQGFQVVEKIAAPIEDLEKAIGQLVSGIQGGQTAYLKPMAAGGFVATPTPALVGEAGPEVVMPLDRFERAIGLGNKEGSSYNISINAGMGSDPVSIGREVVNAIKRYESVSGKVFASA